MKAKLIIIVTALFSVLCVNAQILPEGTYVIRSAVNQNFVVDLDRSNAKNGSIVHLWQYNSGAKNQQWRVKHERGAIVIQSEVNRKYVLDLVSKRDGGAINLWAYHGGKNQKWFLTYDNGAYVIRSATNQNYVVDLDRGDAMNYGRIHLWTYYKGANNQRWIFQRVD